MSSNPFGFNFEEITEETRGFGLLPPGEYLVEIVSSEAKDTKSGTGKYVNFKYIYNSNH